MLTAIIVEINNYKESGFSIGRSNLRKKILVARIEKNINANFK